MSNIFNLIENFIDIINNKWCLIMDAKYYNSSMNKCAQFTWPILSAALQKLYGQLHSFQKRKWFSYGFCVSCQLANFGVSSWSVSITSGMKYIYILF